MKINNWYVLTGAPCSGKTTLIKLLAKKGYQVVPELARVYIDQELAKGITLEELRKDELSFQRKILEHKVNFEKTLPSEAVIFFDRGIPDSEAYFKLCGLEHDEVLEKIISDCFYKKVFLLDAVEYKKDYARTETKEEQMKLHSLIRESYEKLGIPLISVPTFSKSEIGKRLDIILNNL